MNTNQDELIISTPNCIKVAYFIGLIMFFFMSCVFGSWCYQCFIKNKFGGVFTTGAMCLFSLSLCYYAFILIKFQNVKIRLTDESCNLIKDNNEKSFLWNTGLKYKDHNFFQVLELFDSHGERLIMVDYYIPKFSLLKEIIYEKLKREF